VPGGPVLARRLAMLSRRSRFSLCALLVFLSACEHEDNLNERAAKRGKVECAMTRVAGGKKATVKATVPIENDAFASSDTLQVFVAHYGFLASVFDNVLDITMEEHEHVQDEVGAFSCGEIPKKKGQFCKEEIGVDKHLGDDTGKDERVIALIVTCSRL
jgi:hypothetical protein